MEGRLTSYIRTRDRKLEKYPGYRGAPLRKRFDELVEFGRVTVGGRSSCGGAIDPTWLEFTYWNEIVKKAKSFGYSIAVVEVKHGNSWATKAGGFWYEREYCLHAKPTNGN